MKTTRAFIAIELPESTQETLRSVSDGLQAKLGRKLIRWLPPENIHLTLKFFKKLTVNDTELVITALRELVAEFTPFSLKLNGLGIYPSPQRPRVIWLGVEEHPELIDLQQRLLSEIVRLGYPAERRLFSPHLTLGRLRRNVPSSAFANISQAVVNERLELSSEIKVKEAVLFRSELKASGAVHTKLFTAKLGRHLEEPQLN